MVKKQRKPRSVRKKYNRKSEDLCPHCYSFGCDHIGLSFSKSIAAQKIQRRINQGLCPACGKFPCACKSSIFTNDTRYTEQDSNIKRIKENQRKFKLLKNKD